MFEKCSNLHRYCISKNVGATYLKNENKDFMAEFDALHLCSHVVTEGYTSVAKYNAWQSQISLSLKDDYKN